MLTIINYGLGNIQALVNLYRKLHIPIKVATYAKDIEDASKLILPGVGSFDMAMKHFNNSGLREKVEKKVFENKTPILGICVGMQLLAEKSDEGTEKGLNWIGGTVKKFPPHLINKYPLPHMGWNDVIPTQKSILFQKIEAPIFYFLHSFFFKCDDKKHSIAITNYDTDFCCAVNKDNVYGVQFHPEKSHYCGLKLLKSFAEEV